MVSSLFTYWFLYSIVSILAFVWLFVLSTPLVTIIAKLYTTKNSFRFFIKGLFTAIFLSVLFANFGDNIIAILVFFRSEYRHLTVVAILAFFVLLYIEKQNRYDYLNAIGAIVFILWFLIFGSIIFIKISINYHLFQASVLLYNYLIDVLPGAFKILPFLIVGTLVMIFILLCFINFSRIRKIIASFIKEKVKESSQDSIIELIYTEDGQGLSNDAQKILLMFKKYRFTRTIFTDELLRMHEILFGNINERINNILNLWDINRDAAFYLYHTKWHYKIKGLRIYAQLGDSSEVEYLSTLIQHNNKVLRIEAQIALARLSNDEHPLEYLKDLETKMTLWEQINLIHYFTRFNKSVGDISSLLKTNNASVTFFGLRCAAIFNQYEHYNQVIKLTQHDEPLIQNTAYDTLAQYHEPASAKYILNRFKSDLPITTRVAMIKALGHIGNVIALPFLKDLLLFEVEYQLSIELFKSIIQIDALNYEKCESVGEMKIVLIAEYINESKL